jgi:hypothetical protein
LANDNPVAIKIAEQCAVAFPQSSADCNAFVKAVAAPFFVPALFDPEMDADAIIIRVSTSSDWTQLGKSHANAIRDAKNGFFVIAGMTADELESDHGHLAVVIGDDGALSGTVLVPICYAGSLEPVARVRRKRISETFNATLARESRISYFSRKPNAGT